MNADEFLNLMRIAYGWLQHFESEDHLQTTTRQLINQIHASIDDNHDKEDYDFTADMEMIQRLIKTSNLFTDPLEQAYTLLECGLTAVGIGRMREAKKMLEDSIIKFLPRQYEAAIARWILGCILWQIDDRHDDAVVAWSQSMESLQALATDSTETSQRNWYQECLKEMIPLLESEFKVSHKKGKTTSTKDRDTTSPQKAPPFSGWEDLLQLFPVVEEVSAGQPRYVGGQNFPTIYLEISQVLINEQPYRIVSIHKDEHLINIGQFDVKVLVVTGNSMNRFPMGKYTGINDGDYVLVRRCAGNDVNNGDVVVAEIDDIDTLALLKEYVYRNNKHILIAHSSEKYPRKEFAAKDERFNIWGVALAVFKPLQENEED